MRKIAVAVIAVLCVYSVAFAAEDPAKTEAKGTFTTVCAECHGIDGAKGLKGKTAEYVTKALSGYKAKTYGGPKKAIMEEKVAKLSDAQIKALGEHVGTLK